MATKDKRLRTVGDVLEVVGVARARKIAKITSRDAHYMWKNRRKFPPNTYAAFTTILAQQGYSAPASLWSQREVA